MEHTFEMPTHFTVEENTFYDYANTVVSEDDVERYTDGTFTLYPKYKYSREELLTFIRKQDYCHLNYDRTSMRVYWLGKVTSEWRKMITEIEYSLNRAVVSPEYEDSVYQINRREFVNVLYFTPLCVKLFLLRLDVELRADDGVVLDWFFLRSWQNARNFFNHVNGDCIGLGVKDKPTEGGVTIRNILYGFLLIRSDGLFNN